MAPASRSSTSRRSADSSCSGSARSSGSAARSAGRDLARRKPRRRGRRQGDAPPRASAPRRHRCHLVQARRVARRGARHAPPPARAGAPGRSRASERQHADRTATRRSAPLRVGRSLQRVGQVEASVKALVRRLDPVAQPARRRWRSPRRRPPPRRLEGGEHVVDRLPGPPDPQPVELVAPECGDDVAQPMAEPDQQPHLAERQVDVVADHQQVVAGSASVWRMAAFRAPSRTGS